MQLMSFLRERDKFLLDLLAGALDDSRRNRRMSFNMLSAKARIAIDTVKNVIYGERGNIRTLLRITDALDYDIVLVKRTRVVKFWEIPGATEQLNKLKRYNSKKKAEERERARKLKDDLLRAEAEQDFLKDD